MRIFKPLTPAQIGGKYPPPGQPLQDTGRTCRRCRSKHAETLINTGNEKADSSPGNENNSESIVQSIEFVDIMLFNKGKVTGYVGMERMSWFLSAFSDCRTLEIHCQSSEGDVYAVIEYPTVSFSFTNDKTVKLNMRGQLAITCIIKDGSMIARYNYGAVKTAVESYCEKRLSNMFFELSAVSGNDIFELSLRYELKYGKKALDLAFSDTIELESEAYVILRAVA